MPIHDWTRVSAGSWHDFHVCWIAEIRNALNGGLLPEDYYAQAEQIVGPFGPDVLTLQYAEQPENGNGSLSAGRTSGGLAVATSPPRAKLIAENEKSDYIPKRRTIVIHHSSDDTVVALLEVVSPGNKSSRNALRSFVEKAAEAIHRGYNLLVIDLFPPGKRDPQGMHAAIWAELCDTDYQPPSGEPLTLAAYSAGPPQRAYVETTAVGRTLLEMPLFLEPEIYINVPLEATYQAAYKGVPKRWRAVLEHSD